MRRLAITMLATGLLGGAASPAAQTSRLPAPATGERWFCYTDPASAMLSDILESSPEIVLTREGQTAQPVGKGRVLVAGVVWNADFHIEGIDRRWDWNDGMDMIAIGPGGDGAYFDFRRLGPGETHVQPRQQLHCILDCCGEGLRDLAPEAEETPAKPDEGLQHLTEPTPAAGHEPAPASRPESAVSKAAREAGVPEAYYLRLRDQISSIAARSYPRRSLDLGEEGSVVMLIRVREDGSVIDIDINEERTNASPRLQRAAQRAVLRAAPFEPLPAGAGVKSIELPVEYRIAPEPAPRPAARDTPEDRFARTRMYGLIQRQIQANWRRPPALQEVDDMAVILEFQLQPDGTIHDVRVSDAELDRIDRNALLRPLLDSAQAAILRTGKISGLSPEEYAVWRRVRLNFRPAR